MQPETYDIVALYANSLLTLTVGAYILYLLNTGKLRKHSFFLSMGVGFLFYGTEIAIRGLALPPYFETLLFLILSLMFFVSVSLGLWSLTRKTSVFYALLAIYFSFFLLITLWAAGYLVGEMLLNVGSLVSFFTIIVLVLQHRSIFGKTIDKFLFGWLLLLISNFLLYNSGWIIDVLAIFSKLVILYGITDYDFAIISQRLMNERQNPVLPLTAGLEKEGGFFLVISHSMSPIDDLPWIRNFVKQNIEQGLVTYLFVFQDILPYFELRRLKWMKPDMVSIFIFSSSSKKEDKEFIFLPMDLSDLGSSIAEIADHQRKTNKESVIILSDLSQLIHFFNPLPIYKTLVSKMGLLRQARLRTYGIIHPETHQEANILPLFMNIANDTINI